MPDTSQGPRQVQQQREEFWGTDPDSLFPYPVERKFYVEYLSPYGNSWCFVTEVSDIQQAIELMACWRTVKNEPTRIVQKFKEIPR